MEVNGNAIARIKRAVGSNNTLNCNRIANTQVTGLGDCLLCGAAGAEREGNEAECQKKTIDHHKNIRPQNSERKGYRKNNLLHVFNINKKT